MRSSKAMDGQRAAIAWLDNASLCRARALRMRTHALRVRGHSSGDTLYYPLACEARACIGAAIAVVIPLAMGVGTGATVGVARGGSAVTGTKANVRRKASSASTSTIPNRRFVPCVSTLNLSPPDARKLFTVTR